jgi:hypothetical protein
VAEITFRVITAVTESHCLVGSRSAHSRSIVHNLKLDEFVIPCEQANKDTGRARIDTVVDQISDCRFDSVVYPETIHEARIWFQRDNVADV